MGKKRNKNNFAKKYWRFFEKLVILLLKKKLENKKDCNIYAYKTPDQKDGGYDGVIFIEFPTVLREKLQTLYTILVEAKLRQNVNKDLPLSDFAKTFIIAINRSASEVYVYTNLHYSLETYRRVKQFSEATSLAVKLIDIFELCDELNAFPEIQSNFPPEFIQQLFKAVSIHKKEKRISYEHENIFENILPKLTGDYRNNLLAEYAKYFKEHSGIFMVTGIQGCGKRLLIKHLLNSLQHTFNCRFIALEKFTTIKGFFVHLLSLIWNVDVIDIFSLTEENIDEILSYMPVQYCPQRVKQVLLNILKDIPTEYDNRQDVLEEHLIEYLYYIFIPICQRKKQVFAFVNFDKCTDNILNFTNKFIRKFSTENIIILTELRTDEPRTQIYIDEWSKLNPNKKPMELSEFNYSEYIQYMNDNHSDKDMKTIEKLYNICFPLPIYIDNLISIIDSNNIEKLLFDSALNIQRLYNNDNFKSKLILYSVKQYFADKSIYCKKLAYIVVFFDGELALDNIDKLGNVYLDAAKSLSDSVYFDLEKNHLLIHHLLYLKAFQNDTILNEYEYISTMRRLYNIINDFEMNDNIIKIKKLEIAIALKEENYILQHWEKICRDLIRQNDFSYAKQFLKKILDNFQLCNSEKLKLINCILTCYLGLNEHNSTVLLSYFYLGESLKKDACPLEWNKFCYLNAKHKISLGKYQEIIDLTNDYRNEDSDLRFMRALAIKHMYGIDACLLSIKRGKYFFPEDWHLQYAYLDHLHSKYEKIDYKKSWDYLIQIERYYDKLNLEDQVHYQYNKIALELYKDQVTNIDNCKKLFCKTFENILPVEMGRTHNLLGQIYYLKSNLESAINEFEMALDVLSKNMHATYIYVPMINLALIYNELDDSVKCIQYFADALKFLDKYKTQKIKKQLKNFNKQMVIEKECAAFVLAMELLSKRKSEVCIQYFDKFPEYDLQIHDSSKFPSYYCIDGKFTFRC